MITSQTVLFVLLGLLVGGLLSWGISAGAQMLEEPESTDKYSQGAWWK